MSGLGSAIAQLPGRVCDSRWNKEKSLAGHPYTPVDWQQHGVGGEHGKPAGGGRACRADRLSLDCWRAHAGIGKGRAALGPAMQGACLAGTAAVVVPTSSPPVPSPISQSTCPRACLLPAGCLPPRTNHPPHAWLPGCPFTSPSAHYPPTHPMASGAWARMVLECLFTAVSSTTMTRTKVITACRRAGTGQPVTGRSAGSPRSWRRSPPAWQTGVR